MSKARELTKDTFDTAIASGVSLVDFWAPWCAPCKAIAPHVDAVADTYEGKLVVGKVNVDNETDLAMTYDVSSIPTLLIFKDGQLVKRIVGLTPKEELVKAIDEASA